jgi:hypothetical protein
MGEMVVERKELAAGHKGKTRTAGQDVDKRVLVLKGPKHGAHPESHNGHEGTVMLVNKLEVAGAGAALARG